MGDQEGTRKDLLHAIGGTTGTSLHTALRAGGKWVLVIIARILSAHFFTLRCACSWTQPGRSGASRWLPGP